MTLSLGLAALLLTSCQPLVFSGGDQELSPPAHTSLPDSPSPTFLPTLEQTIPIIETPTEAQLLIFHEDFSGSSNCIGEFEEPGADVSVVEEELRISMEAGQILSLPCETIVTGDFTYQVNFRFLETPEIADYYVGVEFRISGEERYGIVFGRLNNYCVYYVDSLSFLHLSNSTAFVEEGCWVPLPSEINLEGAQQVQVVTRGERMDFYLNGVLLTVLRDPLLERGRVGLVAATAEQGGLLISFDDLFIWEN